MIRTSDFVARYGGEEFVVVAPDCDLSAAVRLAERFRTAIAQLRIDEHGDTIPVTTSVGVAAFTDLTRSGPAELLRRADEALYRAKQAGRNATWFWEQTQSSPAPATRIAGTSSREPKSLPLRCRAGIDRGPAHAMIGKPQGGHPRQIENVAAIENDRLAQQPDHDLEIGIAELVPLGGDHQRIGLLECSVGTVAIRQSFAVDRADVGQRLGVMNPQIGAGLQQRVDQDQGRRLADIVGAGLEGQAPDRDRPLAQRSVEVRFDLSERARSSAPR